MLCQIFKILLIEKHETDTKPDIKLDLFFFIFWARLRDWYIIFRISRIKCKIKLNILFALWFNPVGRVESVCNNCCDCCSPTNVLLEIIIFFSEKGYCWKLFDLIYSCAQCSFCHFFYLVWKPLFSKSNLLKLLL